MNISDTAKRVAEDIVNGRADADGNLIVTAKDAPEDL